MNALTVDNRNLVEIVEMLEARVGALRAELAKERRAHALALAQKDQEIEEISRLNLQREHDLSFVLERSIQLEREARSDDSERKVINP